MRVKGSKAVKKHHIENINDCVLHEWSYCDYILNTPNLGSPIGAFSAALKLSPSTARVSAGSMTPSSHNLQQEVVWKK